ncbi:MAG: hypothetical protein QOH88_2769 [Verrucomicrobiota bacterium]|jgi:hypothetical protein
MLDHPWIILIAVAFGFLRWLSQKAEAAKPTDSAMPDDETPPSTRGSESQTEEERIRRFLEALGQPGGTKPPPKVTPKREVRPRIFPTLPPLKTAPPPLPQATTFREETRAPAPVIPRRVFTPAPVQEAGFEVRDFALPLATDLPADRQALRSRLATSEGLRDAIVLREIFGPPRSMQPLDSMSGF